MDLSQLIGVGKIAGIGGVALGILVLLLGPVIQQSSTLSEPARGWLLLTITAGAFAIGALGLIVWRLGNRSSAQRAQTQGDDAEARNVDRSKSSAGGQNARTTGNRSPAINERGR